MCVEYIGRVVNALELKKKSFEMWSSYGGIFIQCKFILMSSCMACVIWVALEILVPSSLNL